MKTIIKMKSLFVIVATFFSVLIFSQITTKKVSFPKGKTETTIKGLVKGEQTIEYTIQLRSYQEFKVSMKTNVNACYFNVIAPDGTFIFTGETAENKNFSGQTGLPGVYKIQVYNMRSVARRGTPSSYTINVSAY